MSMPADLLRLFSASVAAFVALLMLRAALHKAADADRFQGVLADYGLAPTWALTPLRVLLPTDYPSDGEVLNEVLDRINSRSGR